MPVRLMQNLLFVWSTCVTSVTQNAAVPPYCRLLNNVNSFSLGSFFKVGTILVWSTVESYHSALVAWSLILALYMTLKSDLDSQRCCRASRFVTLTAFLVHFCVSKLVWMV